MSEDSPTFKQYQQQFTAHVRNPKLNKPPKGVTIKQMSVYTEIVFNNIMGSVSSCYPVSQQVLGKRAWQKLVRGFFTDYQSNTPIFREIPEQFLQYINSCDDLPPYLAELAHYEWVELSLAVRNIADLETVDFNGDLLEGKPQLNPALENLSYHYPVHRISKKVKPKSPSAEPVHLLVHRDVDLEVQFIEINPVTARLIELLQESSYTGRQALEIIASEIGHPDPEVIVTFGATILADLKDQGVILGVSAD